MSNSSTPPVPATTPTGRPRFVALVQDDCTGCNTCVDYCLVDCIDPAVPTHNLHASSAVHVREDECIGCVLCAKICEALGVNAIRLIPADNAAS